MLRSRSLCVVHRELSELTVVRKKPKGKHGEKFQQLFLMLMENRDITHKYEALQFL